MLSWIILVLLLGVNLVLASAKLLLFGYGLISFFKADMLIYICLFVCLFVCLLGGIRVTGEFFTHFHLYSALMIIEHCLWVHL